MRRPQPSHNFNTEFAFFIAHQDELVQRYPGMVLVLRGEEVVGAYGDALEAYLLAKAQYPSGTFMLQPCAAGHAAYTVDIATVDLP